MEKNKLDTTNIYPYYAGIGVESDQSREQFLTILESLPQSLSNFLISDETANSIAKLSEYFDLDDAQTEIISWIIRNITIGDTYIKELPWLLNRMTNLSIEKSTEISSYIIKNILAPYWEDVHKIQIEKFGNEQSSPPLPKSTDFGTPSPSFSRNQSHYPGEELPETGGNIIDLRNSK